MSPDVAFAAYLQGDPVGLVEELLPRWEASDADHVWISRFPADVVRERARALAALGPEERRRLPLFGVPFAVKDNIDVAGLPTTAACPAYAYEPASDAPVVATLLAAGAICVGKTNLDQFATGLVGVRSPYGVPRNPAAPDRVPGGSSSGSAVAVAAGLAAFSLGTDTAGSGRVPANDCGIVGLKPAQGELSTVGVVPACPSLDCPSVFARSVEEALVVHGVLAGRRWDVTPATGPFTIGVPDERELAACSPAVVDAFRRTIAGLEADGHTIVPIDLSPFFEAGSLLYDGPWIAERTAVVGEFIEHHPDAVEPAVRELILAGRRWSAVDAHRGRWQLDRLRAATAGVWTHVDALVIPTAPDVPTVEAALADSLTVNAPRGRYTNFVNLLGLVALAVPGAARDDGVPFGVSLVGPPSAAAVLAALGTGSGAAGTDGDGGSDTEIEVAVVGAHLRGFPLNDQLTDRGARLVQVTTTAPCYRLFRLRGGAVERPALERVGTAGRAIDVEVWAVPAAAFGSFVAGIAPPLGIGTVTLVDGRDVRGFICETEGLADAEDITAFGGWRRYHEACRDAAAT